MHMNIRSIAAHFEELEITIDLLRNPHVIGIAETWLNFDNEALYIPDGYQVFT